MGPEILEVIARYGLEPKKQAGVYVCFCPFHEDVNRPNFTVYPETNSYYCYSCSVGGDPVHFVSLIEKISREEAFEKVYANLQFLIDKLTVEKKAVPYNAVVNLQISRVFQEYLFSHPERLNDVKKLMKEVDDSLLKELSFSDATKLISSIFSALRNYRPR